MFEGGYWEVCKIKIVSDLPQRLQIHYETLPAERIEYEMTNFLNFINKDSENAYIKSAIAQLWLAIIHLYGDGNSRLARALEHFWLSVSGIKIYYSISSVIYSNKKGYYEILEQTTKLENNLSFDFTAWIMRHLETVNSSIKEAINLVNG